VLVVEIIEYQRDVSNSDACSFFMKDLADANEVSLEEQHIDMSQVLNLLEDEKERVHQLLPNFSLPEPLGASQLYACIAKGSQKVAQGKKSTNAHYIDVELCVLRLENVETDLLITLSAPRRETNRGGGVGAELSNVFKEILTSLNIQDWSLFG